MLRYSSKNADLRSQRKSGAKIAINTDLQNIASGFLHLFCIFFRIAPVFAAGAIIPIFIIINMHAVIPFFRCCRSRFTDASGVGIRRLLHCCLKSSPERTSTLNKAEKTFRFFSQNICFVIFYPYICIVSIVYRYGKTRFRGVRAVVKSGSEMPVDAISSYTGAAKTDVSKSACIVR